MTHALVAVVGLIGATLFVVATATTNFASLDVTLLVILAVAAALAQRFRVMLFGQVGMSVLFGVTMAAVVTLGIGPAIWINLVAAAVAAVTPSLKPVRKIVFNAGNLVLSTYLAGAAFQLSGAAAHTDSIVWTIFGAIIAGTLSFAVSTGLVATVAALEAGESIRSLWQRNYGWTTMNFIAVAINGAAVGLVTSSFGPTAALVSALPFGVAWYTYRLYMGKSTEVRLQNEALRVSASQLASSNLQLSQSNASIVGALIGSLEAKDHYTTGHCAGTAFQAAKIAAAMGLSPREIAAVELGALFHDIGKIGIPEDILRKAGPLTESEWTIMRSHPRIGASILARVPTLANVTPIVLGHHERFDGSGYPNGAKGEDIPLGARIVAVADAYHAMTSTRTYRVALSRQRAVWELEHHAGTQFDPKVVSTFLEILAKDRLMEPEPDHVHMYEKAFAAVRWVA